MKNMKIKTYLFRSFIGLTAFFFSVGIFAVGRYLFTAAPEIAAAPPVYMAEPELSKYHDFTKAEPIVAQANGEENAEAAKFDAEGTYYIAGEETPKGFEDFESFSITNKDYETENEDDYGKLIAPKGYVQTKREIKFTRISLGSGQLQFETERVKGINYSFSGEFTETRNFNYLDSAATEKVLKGVLIKKRDGKKIAETQADFGWMIAMSCGC